MNSLFESYWPFIYIISHFFFQTSDSNPTLFYHSNYHISIRKWQRAITICFVCYIYTLIWLNCYIFWISLLYFIDFFFEHNLYCFCIYHIKKVSLYIFSSKSVYTIRLVLLFRKTWSHFMNLNNHLSTLFLVYFQKRIIWNLHSVAIEIVTALVISGGFLA